jgi:hypothetical protein
MYSPFEMTDEDLSKYVGTYRDYEVELQNSTLYILNDAQRIAWNLVPMSENQFLIENDYEYNVRFDTDESGNVNALVFLHWYNNREIRIASTD